MSLEEYPTTALTASIREGMLDNGPPTSNSNNSKSQFKAPPTMEYSNYDVLVDSPGYNEYMLDNYADHVGNSRFSVLADMYREAFEVGLSKGHDEECQSIIDRIYEVQCHKSISSLVQSGRFLVSVMAPDGHVGSPDDEWWCELDESQGKTVVRQALIKHPEEDVVAMSLPVPDLDARKRGRTASLLRRSASESTLMDDKKKTTRVISEGGLSPTRNREYSPPPPPRRSSVANPRMMSSSAFRQVQMSLMSSVSSNNNDESDSDEEDNYAIHQEEELQAPVVTSTNHARTEEHDVHNNHGDGNRRVSAAFALNRSQPLRRIASAGAGLGNRFVSSIEGLDVVFGPSGRQLSTKPGIVGNNRLQVMLSLQARLFSAKSYMEQETIVADLIKAVKVYWGGRLLIEEDDPESSLMIEMSPPQAFGAMRALLTPEGEDDDDHDDVHDHDYDHAATATGDGFDDDTPLPWQQEEDLGQESSGGYRSTSGGSLLDSNYPPDAATIKVLEHMTRPSFDNPRTMSSEEILKNGMAVVGKGALSMQSDAIKSLQQRKAKRGLAKSLGRDIVGKTGVEQGAVNPEFVKLKNLA
jgi:hypothetical protein